MTDHPPRGATIDEAQLAEWERKHVEQDGYCFGCNPDYGSTRWPCDAVVLLAALRAAQTDAAAQRGRVVTAEALLVKGQRDRHADLHELIPFERCKRGDCCAVLATLAPQPAAPQEDV